MKEGGSQPNYVRTGGMSMAPMDIYNKVNPITGCPGAPSNVAGANGDAGFAYYAAPVTSGGRRRPRSRRGNKKRSMKMKRRSGSRSHSGKKMSVKHSKKMRMKPRLRTKRRYAPRRVDFLSDVRELFERRNKKRKTQKGGYHQYMGNVPWSPVMSTGGELATAHNAEASPSPFEPINTCL